jgi:hypothetical protein
VANGGHRTSPLGLIVNSLSFAVDRSIGAKGTASRPMMSSVLWYRGATGVTQTADERGTSRDSSVRARPLIVLDAALD